MGERSFVFLNDCNLSFCGMAVPWVLEFELSVFPVIIVFTLFLPWQIGSCSTIRKEARPCSRIRLPRRPSSGCAKRELVKYSGTPDWRLSSTRTKVNSHVSETNASKSRNRRVPTVSKMIYRVLFR